MTQTQRCVAFVIWIAVAQVHLSGTDVTGRQLPASRASSTQTGTISGVVTDRSGAPVRLASVTLVSSQPAVRRSVTTDANGRFMFVGLRAGRYNLTANKQGFVRTGYGARAPGRPGIAVPLIAGQTLNRIDIVLARGGAVGGVVYDEAGDPAANMAVRVHRVAVQDGERRLQQVGGDQTDDRGAYRVFQLPPGQYFVSATREGPGSPVSVDDPPDVTAAAATGYAPIFYPGTPLVGHASPIVLDVSEERLGLDFQVQAIPTARVAGEVRADPLHECRDSEVALVPIPLGPEAITNDISTTRTENGRFEFEDVGPGSYRISARCTAKPWTATQPGDIRWAVREVSVAGKDVLDLNLNLRPGLSVSGTLSVDRAASARVDVARARVMLVPRGAEFNETGSAPAIAHVDALGQFSIAGVPPGTYEVVASVPGGARGGSSAWTLSSALADGREALDFFLEILPDHDVHGVMLTLTDRKQTVSGSLVDSGGWPVSESTVVVFPADARYWVPDNRRIASTRPGLDGRFVFADLPPGNYHLAALADVSADDLYDAAFLKHLVGGSLPIALTPGGTVAQSLRVGR